MAENKTQKTAASVGKFLAAVKDPVKRADCLALAALFEKVAKDPAKMWGPAIVGFGTHHYKYDTGREGDSPTLAFSPRATSIVVYGLRGGYDSKPEFAEKLGKVRAEVGCIHIKKLADIDVKVLEKIAGISQKLTYATHKRIK